MHARVEPDASAAVPAHRHRTILLGHGRQSVRTAARLAALSPVLKPTGGMTEEEEVAPDDGRCWKVLWPLTTRLDDPRLERRNRLNASMMTCESTKGIADIGDIETEPRWTQR